MAGSYAGPRTGAITVMTRAGYRVWGRYSRVQSRTHTGNGPGAVPAVSKAVPGSRERKDLLESYWSPNGQKELKPQVRMRGQVYPQTPRQAASLSELKATSQTEGAGIPPITPTSSQLK